MSAFSIRPANESDVPALTRIYEHAVLHGTATYELQPPGEAEMLGRLKALIDRDYPYLVACDTDGTVVAYAYAGPFRARPAYRWAVEDSVYLDPAVQGRGIGTALLIRLIDECEAKGFRQMIAVIGGADHAPSIKLHERAGFRHIGVFEGSGFKFGRWIDTVLMQLSLNEGATTLPDETTYPGTLT